MRSIAFLGLLAACSSNHDVPADASPDAGADASPPMTAFAYKPAWSGVTAVTVVGAPGGASGPWATLATLTDDGTGAFTGTATLPTGDYDYLFQVTGDADAGTKAATLARYVIDPTSVDFEPWAQKKTNKTTQQKKS